MKTKLILGMVLLLAVVAVGCRSASTVTPDELDPGTIEASIRTQILREYPSETFSVGVSVDDMGVVTLTGSVDTAAEQRRIPQLAASVAGVTKVVNSLTVK